MIQIMADGVLVYDSRLKDYEVLGLKITTGLNKGGTAEIILPPAHPAYGAFTGYKTIVEIYRDGKLSFRGRSLYTAEDFYNQRTVVCEGEMCFFQDAISRPYLYQGTPVDVFTAVVGVYNEQVEEAKRFTVGTITVTDANDYIRMESESAESVLDTVGKLLDRCGGYIVFTTNTQGARVINWYESLSYVCNQKIELGSNLLNFARSGANTNLVTVVVPYGAKDETTGKRVTIEDVNGGLDYVQDDAAVALRGRIMAAVTWDEVTSAANLLRKAQEYLNQNRYVVSSLTLSAADLSYLDKSIDTFQVGDTVRVISKPHAVDDDFLLTERTEDLLNPVNSQITLGKDISTLTDADVAGDNQSRSEMHKAVNQVRSDYRLDISTSVQATEQRLTSLITQTSESILLTVSETYTTGEQLTEAISTSLTQLSDEFLFEFEKLSSSLAAGDAENRTEIDKIYSYISFKDGNIILGSNENSITLTIENDRISFRKAGVEFGSWDGDNFHTGNIKVEVNERAQFGAFAFIPRSNGSLSFLKVGD